LLFFMIVITNKTIKAIIKANAIIQAITISTICHHCGKLEPPPPPPEDPFAKMMREMENYVDIQIEASVSNDIQSHLKGFTENYNAFLNDYVDYCNGQNNPKAPLVGDLRTRAVGIAEDSRSVTAYVFNRSPATCAIPYFALAVQNRLSGIEVMVKLGGYNIKSEVKVFHNDLCLWVVALFDCIFYKRVQKYRDVDRSDAWDTKHAYIDDMCGGWITDTFRTNDSSHLNAFNSFCLYIYYKAGLSALTHRAVLTGIKDSLTLMEAKWIEKGYELNTLHWDFYGNGGENFNTMKDFMEWFFSSSLGLLRSHYQDAVNSGMNSIGKPWFFNGTCDSAYLWNPDSEIIRYYEEHDYVVDQLKLNRNWWIPPTHRDPDVGIPKYPLK